MTTKDYGAAVSGYLDPDNRSFENLVSQAGKPVLDKELNLAADLQALAAQAVLKQATPSGWVSNEFLSKAAPVLSLTAPSSTPNYLSLVGLRAHVNGWLLDVVNTGAVGVNTVDLGAGPSGNGAKRTDLVILEVWRRLLSAAPDTDGKSQTGRIWKNGNVKIPSASDAALNPADDLKDGVVNSETTKRVQIQYRLRVIQDVDIFTYPAGLEDPAVVANTVPASAGAPDGTSTIYTYANQSAAGDPGLWRAGNGVPSNGMGTVDGYMYAIPLCAVFRRNTTAYDKNLNQNGGVASPGPSDRPDGLFHDIIDSEDVADLRRGSWVGGWPTAEVLEKNFFALLDNELRTEWTTTATGGGVSGHTVLLADEIGVSTANGGDGSSNGDTPGAALIGEFDCVRRRFSDRPNYEVVTVCYTPGDPSVSDASWQTGTTVTITPTSIQIFPYQATPFNFAAYAPSGTKIIDVLGARFRGANTVSFGNPDNGTDYVIARKITGLGASPMTDVVLTVENPLDYFLTNEKLYIDLLVAYPAGKGLSRTPVEDFGSASFVVNNTSLLPTTAPHSFSAMSTQDLDYPHREVVLEYETSLLTHTFQAGIDDSTLRLPERCSSASVTVAGSPAAISIAADGRTATITPGPLQFDVVQIDYTALRPVPQTGVQFTVYYKTRAPQAVHAALLGTSQDFTPRYISPHLYVLTAGSGSIGEGYPFPSAYAQTGGVQTKPSSSAWVGEHQLSGTTGIYIANFNAETGFLKLPAHVPYAPDPDAVTFERQLGDIDAEGRAYFNSVPLGTYLPNAYGSPLASARVHKVILPTVMELKADSTLGPKGSLWLVLLVRWAEFDADNGIHFDTLASLANSTTAAVFRLNGHLLNRSA
jgi:hypothetical protein